MKQNFKAVFCWEKVNIDRQLVKHNKSLFKNKSERGKESSSVGVFSKTTAQLGHTKVLAQIVLRNTTLKNVVTSGGICEGRQNFLHLPSAIQSQQSENHC